MILGYRRLSVKSLSFSGLLPHFAEPSAASGESKGVIGRASVHPVVHKFLQSKDEISLRDLESQTLNSLLFWLQLQDWKVKQKPTF